MRYEICKIIYHQLLVWVGCGWAERIGGARGIDYQSAFLALKAIEKMRLFDKEKAIVLRFDK